MKYPQQRGALTGRQEFLYGQQELPSPGGMNTDSDPASIRPWEFVSAINVDFEGNTVKERPGVTKVNPSALHAASARHHPTQFEFGTPFRLWLKGDGCPGESAGDGFYVGQLDFEQEPMFQRASWFDDATTSIAIGGYGGVPYVGVDSILYRQQLIPVPYGSEALSLAGQPAVEVARFPGFNIVGLREFDGFLFVLLDAGAGASKIARYDGRTMNDGTGGTTADLTGIDTPTTLGLWQDFLVCGFGFATGHIRLRARGASPVWTTVAGVISTTVGNSLASYQNKLYGASGGADIWVYDGTGAPANVHTPAGATDVGSLAVTEDAAGLRYLVYGYGAGIPVARLGRFDGTVWTDVHKNINTQITQAFAVPALGWFKSHLAIGVVTTVGGGGGFILVSPGRDTAGTYAVFQPDGVTNGDLHQFEVI